MSVAQSFDLLHRHLSRLWTDDTARPGSLSYSEYSYLRALERLDGAQVARADLSPDQNDGTHHGPHLQDLVEVMGVQKASASAAVAKLQKSGLVERFACQFDARAQHITLTQKAHEHLRTEQAVYDVLTAQFAARLTPNEMNALETLLIKGLK